MQTTAVNVADMCTFLQLWIKAELAKKADANSGPLSQISERFLSNNFTRFLLHVTGLFHVVGYVEHYEQFVLNRNVLLKKRASYIARK